MTTSTAADATTEAEAEAEPEAGPARRLDPRRLPGWAQALLVLAASRVFYTYVVLRCVAFAGYHRDGTPWTYLQIANNWDGTWYQRIAVHGYPAGLLHDAQGAVTESSWAFYPLYPKLVLGVQRLTGLGWEAAGTGVSLLAAAGAVVLVRSLTARVAGPRNALWTVALLCFFPTALVLQLPYSEALALFLLVAVLWCLQRGRHLLAVPALLLVGLARPVGAPLAAVLVVHLLARAWSMRGLPRRRAARALAGPLLATVAAGVAAVEWPLLVWWATGVPDGYAGTMAAWRSPPELVLLRPMVEASQHYLGHHLGPLVMVAGFAGLVWWLARAGLRVVGLDLAVWCGAYAAYLLAVLDTYTSLPRYLLTLFPLGTMLVSTSRSRAFRIAVTVGFAALGVVWILAIWRSHRWAP